MARSLPTLACASILTSLLSTGAAVPQEEGTGARLFTLDTTFGVQATDNVDLDEDGDSRVSAFTRLGLGFASSTPSEGLTGSLDLGLRASGGSDDDDSIEFVDPDARIAYERQSRDARLLLEGNIRRSQVSELSPLDFVLDETLTAQEIEDLLDGRGIDDVTRLSYALDVTLETRRTHPFGVVYSLGLSGVRYSEQIGSLDDETRMNAGIGLRLDLSEALQTTADFGITTYDNDLEDAFGADFGVSRRFATARLGARLGFVTDDTGPRNTLAVTGAREFKTGTVDGEVGVTRLDDGGLEYIGATGASFDLQTSNVRFDLSRRVAQVEDENDDASIRTVTSLSSTYTRQMTRAWQLGVDVRYVRTRDQDDESVEGFGQVGVDISRALTRDWSLTMGASHRFESDRDGDDASGTALSASLTRSVQLPF